MPNTFSPVYVEKLQKGLSQQFIHGSVTGWMEGNANGVDYRGGKFITMTTIETDGMGDYDRSLGYPRGAITGYKKEFELTQDRGREFVIDVADNDETGFLVTAASVTSEFQKRYVIPEIDSYRINQLYTRVLAEHASNVDATNIIIETITDTLIEDIATIRDIAGDQPLVVMMSGLTQAKFGKDFMRTLDYVNFSNGTFSTKLRNVDGTPIQVVPSARMKTAYDKLDGISVGEEAGGYVPAAGAGDIKWIITPVSAPIAVAKIDKIRVFTPEQYQAMNAWKLDYRVYHDLWITHHNTEFSFIRTGDLVNAVV